MIVGDMEERPSLGSLMDRPLLDRPALERPSLMPKPVQPNGTQINREDSILTSLSTGKLRFPDDHREFLFNSSHLEDTGPIGSGNFGTVYRMIHRETRREMAVKRIRCTNISPMEQQRLMREHDTIMNADKCPNIVKFFGAIFHEGDCWICMELMAISLDNLYKRVYKRRNMRFPEFVIGHIAVSTITALSYLKTHLQIIHRDVKPSNILVNMEGTVKLCDFGICGKLEDSVAKTHDAGCRPYLAPERVSNMAGHYDIRSDVWSLGITLFEISTGNFPYAEWRSPFDQITTVVDGDPPKLQLEDEYNFSVYLVNFVNKCLTKERKYRPKYAELQEQPFYTKYAAGGPDIEAARKLLAEYIAEALQHPEVVRG